MTKIERYSLVCNKCKCNFKARLYDSINVTLDHNLIRLIYEGKFNVVTCPECRNKSYVLKWFLFHDMQKKMMIEVFPRQINQFIKFLLDKKYFREIGKKPHYINSMSITLSEQQSKFTWKNIADWFKKYLLNKKPKIDDKFKNAEIKTIEEIISGKKQKNIRKGLTDKEVRRITQQQILKPSRDIVRERQSAIAKIAAKNEFKGFCEFCNKEVIYIVNRFYCNYCFKWHCEKHRLPEEHSCSGKPKAPPGAFRELHTRKGVVVIGK